MNNKGFAVTTVLYTVLIAFLLFLAIALSNLASSSSLLNKANDDIVNGVNFTAQLKKTKKSDGTIDCTRVIQIKGAHGTIYWPADFVKRTNGASLNRNDTITIRNQYRNSNNLSSNYSSSNFKTISVERTTTVRTAPNIIPVLKFTDTISRASANVYLELSSVGCN